MNILVMNCGSSSLKYQLINMETKDVLAKGICERIGIEGSRHVYSAKDKDKRVIEKAMPNHSIAVNMVLETLIDKEVGVINGINDIKAVGHRVLNAGKYYPNSVIVDENVKNAIRDCFDLGPLHNPANLTGIIECEAAMPNIPQIAVFDTAFHQTMPPKAYLYAIPKEYREKYNIRRYGFHGTSHSYVSKRLVKFTGLDINNSKVIVCHLGNGSSISAVMNGKCVDTTMGFTPLEGLMMGTRSGDIDPAVVEFLMNKEGLSVKEVMDILNKKSGVLAMSGISSDFRDVEDAANNGDEDAINTQEAFSYRVAKYIGAYVAAMNGVDAIAFTAGVGENDSAIRGLVCKYLGYLGVVINPEANKVRGKESELTTPDSKVKVCIIPTDEEMAIAEETVALISK
ncbi:acetate/propionate family kinase [Anaeromicropila herbilytica]|uniref:Acetate kinase n=1 Tax=Anaeromicropila herbilytica TaxID=2785025 RepID=A0A7R7ENH2_9FIRM|nr:acetate kinase [Anaeromicropila herbilytica]BCN32052.1 acetate kinase [Anaeromicropila herbilytica]